MSRARTLLALGIASCLALLAFASPALAAKPAWSPVPASLPTVLPPLQSEVQTLSVKAEGGTYTLTFGAQTTTPIAFDAAPGTIEAALNALSSIGGVGASVTVAGGPTAEAPEAPYSIAFGGSKANTDVALITANGAGLTGPTDHVALVSENIPGGQGTTTLVLRAQNIGGFTSNGTITYKAKLSPGLSTTAVAQDADALFGGWACTAAIGITEFTCTTSEVVGPSGSPNAIKVPITAAPGTQSGEVEVEISGAGATAVKAKMPLEISATPAKPGIQTFVAGAFDSNGNNDTRAGGHPYSAGAAIFVNTVRLPQGQVVPAGEFRDIVVDLPPGFLGNPVAVPECPESTKADECPPNTMVGQVSPVTSPFSKFRTITGVYNTEAPYGYPGKFRFVIAGLVPLNAVGSLRSDGDYGLTVGSYNTPQIAQVYGTFFTFWGSPADPSHDAQRCNLLSECASGGENVAFLTSATNCSEQAVSNPITYLNATLWQNPGEAFTKEVTIPPVTDCHKLHFESDFTFEPSSTQADSPASFRTSLTVPSEGLTNPSKLTTPEIKDTVVTLPEGVVLNSAGADGLEACSLDQIGFKGKGFPMPNPIRFTKDAQTCPEASKIGTGELKTALLHDPLKGALYLAAQGEGNPYGSLFAIYLVIEDPRHGIFIKLPGRVDPDPVTGQMKVTFTNLPQLPFTRLDLNLKGGNRSALASPTTCGKYVTTATNTPWSAPESGPPTVSANGFDINQGPNGMPCANTPAERPFEIGWKAGAQSVKAGASGPFNMQITRPDGSQELTSLSLKTPPGVSASLKGIPQCTDAQIAAATASTGKAEQANSACPAASRVGTLQTGAGSGPSPFYVSGSLYLAGPYKGAPLSVVAITPAVAGPFDLGNVVVRNAVKIDRGTAQVSATSDQVPQILKGVVLRIRDVRIKLDRDNWTINPTSCEASAVQLTAKGANGATAERSARFQVGGCADLGFAPKLSAKVIGGTKRGAHPAFEANLTYPQGSYANIKDVQVALPHSEFLDQAHINTICTRVQAAANACPAGAIYGYAEATTPLLDGKLTGPVFLKSSVHKLPDLAIFLKGPDAQPIEVEFQGRIDSIKGQIRNTIEGLPDVPVSSFRLYMKGGKKGLLINSRDLCKGKPGKLTVSMVGQNNKSSESRPKLGNSCKGGKQKKSKHKRSRLLASLGSAW
jgi:hypothetical protein